jgi:hypothetical protein
MPSFAPTEEERAVVKLLSAYGYAQHLIAKLISNRRGSTIDEKTLRKAFPLEIETGKAELDTIVRAMGESW